MAKRYNGTINFASALRPTGAQPLDDRMVVQSLTDLMNFATFEAEGASAAYNGMMVAVLDEQQVFMLIDAANLTSEDAWVAVGSGNGSLAVDTYGEAIALATNDNIGQVIYVKTKSSYDADGEEGEGAAIEYDAAPYIVIGAGQLQKLAASTASGDLDSDVAALKTKVATLESDMDKVEGRMDTAEADITALKEIDHEAYKAADTVLETKLQGEIDKKVSTETYEGKIGEIEQSIETVEGRVKANEDAIAALKEIDHEAYKAADTVLETKLQGEIDKKVDIEDGKRLMTDAEGTKLEGIAEGAQVNVIEVVKVNGTALTVAEADKSVEITIPTAPVQGVADDEKVLSLDGDKLKTTLTLAYVPATETNKAVLRLQGKDDVVVSSIDATAFVKDGMLSGAKLEGPTADETGEKYLVLSFNTEAGKEDIRMDVTELLDYYAAGNGLSLDGKTFTIQLDATAESYLKVTTNGLAVADALWTKVDEKDNAVLEAAKGDATNKANAAQNAATAYTDTVIANLKLADTYEAKGTAQELIEGLKLADTYEAKGTAAGLLEDYEKAMETVLAGKANVGDSYLKDESDAKYVAQVEGERLMTDAEGTKLAGVAEGAQVNVIESIEVNGIAAEVSDDKVANVEIAAKDIKLGVDITGANGDAIYSGETKISTVLQGIQDSIRAAVAGGVNSVTSADSIIEVNNADPNNPKVSIKIEASSTDAVAAGHISLVKGENGLYGCMYYDGDDVE